MIEATLQTEYDFLESYLGTTQKVLFEQEQDGYFEGYTENYCRVKVKSESVKTGEILSVKITDREKDVLIAQIY
jgi:threonylcarbamoyladenosine tRNA methylthiotransferase MtaB